MVNNSVVLVNENDDQIGLMGKREAHLGEGTLHRAISVVIYRDPTSPRLRGAREVLLQKRSARKLLWPGFWADTVSTHPVDGESYVDCAVRRLKEEMGIEGVSDLQLVTKMVYQARYNGEYSEHEVDGLLVGQWNGEVKPDPAEVEDCRWIGWEKLKKEINDEMYATWFQLVLKDKEFVRAMDEVSLRSDLFGPRDLLKV